MPWPRYVRSRILIWTCVAPLLWIWYLLAVECPPGFSTYQKQTSFSEDGRLVVYSYSIFEDATGDSQVSYQFCVDTELGRSFRRVLRSATADAATRSKQELSGSVPGTNVQFSPNSKLGPKGPFTEVMLFTDEPGNSRVVASWPIRGLLSDWLRHTRCIGDCVATISMDGTMLEFHHHIDGKVTRTIPLRTPDESIAVVQSQFHPTNAVIELVLQNNQREYIDINSGAIIPKPSADAAFFWIDRDAEFAWYREGRRFYIVSTATGKITKSFDSQFDVSSALQVDDPNSTVALCDNGSDLRVEFRSVSDGALVKSLNPLTWRNYFVAAFIIGTLGHVYWLFRDANISSLMLLLDFFAFGLYLLVMLSWRISVSPLTFYSSRWEVASMVALTIAAIVVFCVWLMFSKQRWPVCVALVTLACAAQSLLTQFFFQFGTYEAEIQVQFGVSIALQTCIACVLLRAMGIRLVRRDRAEAISDAEGEFTSKALHPTGGVDRSNVKLGVRSLTLREMLLGMCSAAIAMVLLLPALTSTSALEFLVFNSNIVFVDSIAAIFSGLVCLSGLPKFARFPLVMVVVSICWMFHCAILSGWASYMDYEILVSNLPYFGMLCGACGFCMTGFHRLGWALVQSSQLPTENKCEVIC